MSDQPPTDGDGTEGGQPPEPETYRIQITEDCETSLLSSAGSTAAASSSAKSHEELKLPPPHNPQIIQLQHRQQVRADIVKWVLWIIVGTVAAPFLLTMWAVPVTEKLWEFLHIVFPAEIGLLTAAIAFYFDPRG